MENEFSKPKVLIDLEEYELLNEKWLEHDEVDLANDLLLFLYHFRWSFGLNKVNLKTNELTFHLYEVVKADGFKNQEFLKFVETFINNQMKIENEKLKEKR